MRGEHTVEIGNKRVSYQITLRRNITVLCGDSATGKTTLVQMLQRYRATNGLGNIKLKSDVPVVVLSSIWEDAVIMLQANPNSIIVIDEQANYLKSKDFARLVDGSACYFLLITRHPLKALPYSVKEIYEMRGESRADGIVQNELIHVNPLKALGHIFIPELIITEDSNSGYELFKSIAPDDTKVISAGGKSNIVRELKKIAVNTRVLVIVDGAAFGPEYKEVSEYMSVMFQESVIWAYESFEHFLLQSGLFRAERLDEVLENTPDYVESSKYISWERFFTALLEEISRDTPLAYGKSHLNKNYLVEGNRKKIEEEIPEKLKIYKAKVRT